MRIELPAWPLRRPLPAWPLRRPLPPFPFGPPAWPSTVPRPPAEKTLGTAYETEWARRQPARAARAVVQEVLGRPAVWGLCKPSVSGLDRVAHLDEPAIFACNHASHFDAPLVLTVLPERWRHEIVVAGAADYFFDTRLKATAFAFLMNTVPIERQRVSRDSANQLAELVAEGWSLLIFPEGGRSQDGWGQAHKPGAAWLAVRTGRPVVPVHVEGTRQILPRGSRVPRPGTTHVSFGRPLRPGAGDDPRELSAAIERSIGALADERAFGWWAATRRAAAGETPGLTGPEAGAWRRTWALGEGRRAGRRKSRQQ